MKKPLPDHRPQTRNTEYHRPTEDEVKNLAGHYGFAADFDLASRLNTAYLFEESARCIAEDTPIPDEQTKLLEALRDRCHAVDEVVSKLGSNEIRRLDNGLPYLDQFRKDAHRLYLAAHAALAGIEKGKRQRRWNIRNFVWHLADVWQDGTGNPPTCSYSAGSFVGDFYQFACACARLGAISIAGFGDPGSTIRDILRDRRIYQKKSQTKLPTKK